TKACSISRPSSAIRAFWTSSSASAWRKTIPSRSGSTSLTMSTDPLQGAALPATAPGVDLHEMSPLALAFVGDAVLELLVRGRLVATTRLQPGRLHSAATRYVSAKAQFRELTALEPMLTEAETAVLRRGKNASKATVAKHATAQEYRASTGLECLLG